MTRLNEAHKCKICVYCANKEGDFCLKDVPYYALSLHCKYYAEEVLEHKPRTPSIKRIMKRTLVETF